MKTKMKKSFKRVLHFKFQNSLIRLRRRHSQHRSGPRCQTMHRIPRRSTTDVAAVAASALDLQLTNLARITRSIIYSWSILAWCLALSDCFFSSLDLLLTQQSVLSSMISQKMKKKQVLFSQLKHYLRTSGQDCTLSYSHFL